MAWRDVDSSFERFCLTAGIGAIEQMLREDAQQLTGAWHRRGGGRVGHLWGTTAGKIGFHGGKVTVHRPRVRSFDGQEAALATWTAAQAEDWLGRWMISRSSLDRSDAIHAASRSADSATNRREATDFEVPSPAMTGRSPSGSRTARLSLRVDTLINIRFMAQIEAQRLVDARAQVIEQFIEH
jgi:hypothetical protein